MGRSADTPWHWRRFWPGWRFMWPGFPIGMVVGVATYISLRSVAPHHLLAFVPAMFALTTISFWIGMWREERELTRAHLGMVLGGGVVVAGFVVVVGMLLWMAYEGAKALLK